MINPNEHTDHMGSPLHVDLELVGLGGGKAGTGGGGNAGMLHFYQDPNVVGVAGPLTTLGVASLLAAHCHLPPAPPASLTYLQMKA